MKTLINEVSETVKILENDLPNLTEKEIMEVLQTTGVEYYKKSPKTTITVGQSVQVFETGQPEHWNKITISKEFDLEINDQEEIDKLFSEIEEAHKKHSQSVIDNFPPRKFPTDIFFNGSKNKEERI